MKLNHVLVRTSNLAAIRYFWTNIIGLAPQRRPPFPFPGEWFGKDGNAFVHVVEDPGIQADAGPIAHLAIEGAEYRTLMQALEENSVHYHENHVPLSGEHQVFVHGPDGLIVEMIFPKGQDAQSEAHSKPCKGDK